MKTTPPRWIGVAAVFTAALVAAPHATLATEPRRPSEPSVTLPPPEPAPKATLATPVEVDLLIGYTDRVRRAHGERLGDFAAELVDYTNASFERSGIAVRLRLVATERSSYRSTRNAWEDLPHVRDPEGAAADLHRAREQHQADLMVLLVEPHGGTPCGGAYMLTPGGQANDTWAVGVVAHQWAARNRNWESCFAHEIGHLFGGGHAPDNQSDPVAPDAYGYCDTTHRFKTAMVYNNRADCPTATGHFSNPHVSWRGYPTSTVEQHNDARMMNLAAPYIANFRGEVLPEPNRPLLSGHAISPTRSGATGFVRIENLSPGAGTVDIRVSDEEGTFYPTVTVNIGARGVTTVRLDAIADEIGPTEGAWVLHGSTMLEVRGAAYAYGPGWLARTDILLPPTTIFRAYGPIGRGSSTRRRTKPSAACSTYATPSRMMSK